MALAEPRPFALSRWASDLARPVPVAATAVLVVNDHVVKGSGWLPGTVTGKLSDIAGLFVAGVLAVCVVRGVGYAFGRPLRRDGRAGALALFAVGLGFALLKLWPGFNHALRSTWGHNALDATDLYALPVLLLALFWLRDRERAGPARARSFPAAVALVGVVLACAATPAPPPVPPRPVAGWVVDDARKSVACGELAAWVVKSGKTGLGLLVRIVPKGDAACLVRVAEAQFRLTGDGTRITGRQIDIGEPASRIDPRPRRGPAEAAPIDLSRATFHYIVFEFDNNASWNRGDREATFELALEVDGSAVGWVLSAQHRYVSYPVRSRW